VGGGFFRALRSEELCGRGRRRGAGREQTCGVRCGGGGDGEADPREEKKLDEKVVLVSFFLGVEMSEYFRVFEKCVEVHSGRC
jgi:hypothetical protein